MENVIFVVRFLICTLGVGFKIMVGFLRFSEMGLFSKKFANLLFENQLLNQFQFQFQSLSFCTKK